jgi:GH18 family chitinase
MLLSNFTGEWASIPSRWSWECEDSFSLVRALNPIVVCRGFYGRSFTLASADCDHAGCAWTSGGKEGPCSGNSGTLMWAEIESILTDIQQAPKIDEDAAVAYITWDDNQWVSYDTDQTFRIKMNYANDHCIGGTMIWSVDQDDENYKSATLQAVI